jgi:hypothetical protein
VGFDVKVIKKKGTKIKEFSKKLLFVRSAFQKNFQHVTNDSNVDGLESVRFFFQAVESVSVGSVVLRFYSRVHIVLMRFLCRESVGGKVKRGSTCACVLQLIAGCAPTAVVLGLKTFEKH